MGRQKKSSDPESIKKDLDCASVTLFKDKNIPYLPGVMSE